MTKKIKTLSFLLVLLLALPAAVQSNPVMHCTHVLQTPKSGLKTLEKIVANARAYGAQWTADEWKLNSKNALIVVSPLIKQVGDLMKQVDESPDNVEAVFARLEEMEIEFEPYEKLLEELNSIAQKSEIGQAVMEDTAWEQQVMEELGLTDYLNAIGSEDETIDVDTVCVDEDEVEVDSVVIDTVAVADLDFHDELNKLEEIVAAARTESAKWTEEEWKANLRSAYLTFAPLLKKVDDYQQIIGDDNTKAAEFLSELENLLEQFEPCVNLFDELDAIAKSSEVGKAVLEDPEWEKEMKEELGLMGLDL
ncbi:MAG: hypothetical protein J5637_09390 [Prevotella sp.]|nr:hypothetical protein [Prevotella sp.]